MVEKRETHPKPEGQGESAGRRRGLEKGGGEPLSEELEDGQLRGADEEGTPQTGIHGGPDHPGHGGRIPRGKQEKP